MLLGFLLRCPQKQEEGKCHLHLPTSLWANLGPDPLGLVLTRLPSTGEGFCATGNLFGYQSPLGGDLWTQETPLAGVTVTRVAATAVCLARGEHPNGEFISGRHGLQGGGMIFKPFPGQRAQAGPVPLLGNIPWEKNNLRRGPWGSLPPGWVIQASPWIPADLGW